MKKVIYAVSVIAMCVNPLSGMADSTTLYGQLRYSLNSVDEDFVGGQDGLSGEDNVSLFGLQGSYGKEVKAFFHLQTRRWLHCKRPPTILQKSYVRGLWFCPPSSKMEQCINLSFHLLF